MSREKTPARKSGERRFPGEIWKVGLCQDAGNRCGRKASLGHLCARHAKQLGLELRPSRFGGLGLFATMPPREGTAGNDGDVVFFAGEPIAEYGGRLLTLEPDESVSEKDAGVYGMAFGDAHILDGRDSNSSLARFANDGSFEKCNNAEFSHYLKVPSSLVRTKDGSRRLRTPDSVWLEATRDILAGEEILASYGSDYWKGY